MKLPPREVARIVVLPATIVALAALPASGDPETPPVDALMVSRALEEVTGRVLPGVVQVFALGWGAGSAETATEASELLEQHEQSGTGVVVDASGWVVTNAHVVDGARRVRVRLPPSPEELSDRSSILKGPGRVVGARVVGRDRETDVAVLKVEVSGLTALSFGDSDELRPGQLVFAFGSPLGLEGSVSMGVVSATARQFQPEAPMIYIQTDASINPGNSGGPLVDVEGEVVGINTFILSQSGGSEGMGFAAPSNIVRAVYEQIRETGRVRRGEIGVHAQTITPLLAEALALGVSWGVVLGDVVPEGPADRAGLKVGDVVLTLDGKRMENGRQLDVNLYRRPVGSTVTLGVLRAAEPRTFDVEVIERTELELELQGSVTPDQNLVRELGILALDLSPELRRQLPKLRRQSGVLVASGVGGSRLQGAAFEPGDVIYRVNDREIANLAALRSTLAAIPSGQPLAVQIERRGGLRFLALEVP